MLHLNSNKICVLKDQSGYDPVYKGQCILSSLVAKHQTVYTADELLPTDASGGCMYFWVYMKGKPNKNKSKIFGLCKTKTGCQ
jgi:hypothetical protein